MKLRLCDSADPFILVLLLGFDFTEQHSNLLFLQQLGRFLVQLMEELSPYQSLYLYTSTNRHTIQLFIPNRLTKAIKSDKFTVDKRLWRMNE